MWSISRMQSLILIENAFNETNLLRDGVGREQAMESIDMAMERMNIFFRKALVEALETKPTSDARWNQLEKIMESFARQCRPQSESDRIDKVAAVCLLIYEIIRVDGYIIDSRKKLLALAREGRCLSGKNITLKNVSDAVAWCKIEDICRDNTKG